MPESIEQNSSQKSETQMNEKLATVQELHEHTLGGKWEEVVKIYQKDSWFHTRKITISEDTALHVAVDNGEEDVVERLVQEIIQKEKRGPERTEEQKKGKETDCKETKALKMKNVRGDTPLHLAASRGFAAICRVIAEKEIELLTMRNNKGETPIFLAALNWHKDTFLWLHEKYAKDLRSQGKSAELHVLRRDDGDTILHCAIRREHFGKLKFAFH